MRFLQERKIQVPEDISVIGYDDIDNEPAIPSLTSISHCLPEMGRSAVDVAIAIGSGKWQATATNELRVPGTLVIRNSTGYRRPR